ncbi:hypothetical protein VTN96DRAFT_842 [Rasamsonia emersonii]
MTLFFALLLYFLLKPYRKAFLYIQGRRFRLGQNILIPLISSRIPSHLKRRQQLYLKLDLRRATRIY